MQIVADRIKRLFKRKKVVSDEPEDNIITEALEGDSKSPGKMPDGAMIGHGFDFAVIQAECKEDKQEEEVFYTPTDEIVVEDCCPKRVYKLMPFCNGNPESPFWQVWSRHRLLTMRYHFKDIHILINIEIT